MNQRHYNNETYQLQLDSHHRFVEGWDTRSIKLLHSCDAGEYSVLTSYAIAYIIDDYSDYESETYDSIDYEELFGGIFLSRFYENGWYSS